MEDFPVVDRRDDIIGDARIRPQIAVPVPGVYHIVLVHILIDRGRICFRFGRFHIGHLCKRDPPIISGILHMAPWQIIIIVLRCFKYIKHFAIIDREIDTILQARSIPKIHIPVPGIHHHVKIRCLIIMPSIDRCICHNRYREQHQDTACQSHCSSDPFHFIILLFCIFLLSVYHEVL